MSFSPQYETSVDQNVFVEPIKSATRPNVLIERYFPEENYDTSIDSTLTKFVKSILGEAGVGLIRKEFFEARLVLEEYGFENDQLEKFYADPLRFGRNITSTPFSENYDEDPLGILTIEQWRTIQSKDQAYRNRSIDFLHGARLGGTVEGIKLAAKSAAGYEFDLIENYNFIFNQHSDEVIDLESYKSDATARIYDSSEFILIPNQETSRTLIQSVVFQNSELITEGYIKIFFASNSVTVPFVTSEGVVRPKGITSLDIYNALASLPEIGAGNLQVTGSLATEFKIKIFNNYSDQFAKSFYIESYLKYKLNSVDRDFQAIPYPSTKIKISQSWASLNSNETNEVNQYDAHLINAAIDHIKPIDSYASYFPGQSIYQNQPVKNMTASSAYYEVVRHISGNELISWPEPKNGHWIEPGVEKESPRVKSQLSQHYQGFHQPVSIIAYNDEAEADPNYLNEFPSTESSFSQNLEYMSQKSGEFDSNFVQAFRLASYLRNRNPDFINLPSYALANFAEPLNIDTKSEKDNLYYVNGHIPATDSVLSIANEINQYYGSSFFWSSDEGSEGAEILEIDLGSPKAINFLTFETFKVPVNISIYYDVIGIGNKRSFAPVVPESDLYFNTSLEYNYNSSSIPWQYLSYNFTDKSKKIIFSRYIKIKFTRKTDETSIFLPKRKKVVGEELSPWPVFVKNLRIGRNV